MRAESLPITLCITWVQFYVPHPRDVNNDQTRPSSFRSSRVERREMTGQRRRSVAFSTISRCDNERKERMLSMQVSKLGSLALHRGQIQFLSGCRARKVVSCPIITSRHITEQLHRLFRATEMRLGPIPALRAVHDAGIQGLYLRVNQETGSGSDSSRGGSVQPLSVSDTACWCYVRALTSVPPIGQNQQKGE